MGWGDEPRGGAMDDYAWIAWLCLALLLLAVAFEAGVTLVMALTPLG